MAGFVGNRARHINSFLLAEIMNGINQSASAKTGSLSAADHFYVAVRFIHRADGSCHSPHSLCDIDSLERRTGSRGSTQNLSSSSDDNLTIRAEVDQRLPFLLLVDLDAFHACQDIAAYEMTDVWQEDHFARGRKRPM